MKKKNIFPMFTVSMIMYCMAYSTIRNYATLFLRAQGFTNTEVGIFYSLGSAFSIVSQLTLGTLLDKQEKITAKHILAGVTTLAVFDAVLIYFCRMRLVIFWGFVVMNMIILLDKSLFNMFGLAFVNGGYKLDYSLSRGIGSASTFITTLTTGYIISRFSEWYIFIFFFIMQTGLLFVLRGLPYVFKKDIREYAAARQAAEAEKSRSPTFPDNKPGAVTDQTAVPAKRTIALTDKHLWLLLFSVFVIYSCYNAGNNYHINIIEALGGGSKELGVSDAIMAIVELPAMAAFLPLTKKFSYRQILSFSVICFVLKVVCFAFSTNIYQIYAAQVLQLFSYGLFIPVSAYYINDILIETRRGRGQALMGVFTSGLSGLLTSPVIGMILDHFPVKTMLLIVSSVAVFGIAGVLFSTKMIAAKTRAV